MARAARSTRRFDALQDEETQIKAAAPIAHVMNERKDEPMAYILYRGEYDQRRDQVKAATPPRCRRCPTTCRSNRLGLAQWLLRPEHPLTARVTVNRFWQELFGTGLVRTSGDFGVTGELPSHPELLDWLAVEFREIGLGRQEVLQAARHVGNAYRQAAIATPEKLEQGSATIACSRAGRASAWMPR